MEEDDTRAHPGSMHFMEQPPGFDDLRDCWLFGHINIYYDFYTEGMVRRNKGFGWVR